jgi:hypothetical protein
MRGMRLHRLLRQFAESARSQTRGTHAAPGRSQFRTAPELVLRLQQKEVAERS